MENIQNRFLDMKLLKIFVAAILALQRPSPADVPTTTASTTAISTTDTSSSNSTRRRPTTPSAGRETPARLPLRSRQGAGVARLQRHDRHPDADALGLRQGERRVRLAQREAAAADGTVPDHHLLALQRERRADIQRHAPRRPARRRSPAACRSTT